MTAATADCDRPVCNRQVQPIVCTNVIWIERAFRRSDTGTMASVSTFLDGEMIRPGSDLWNALCFSVNTRNVFATGSSHRYHQSFRNYILNRSYAWRDMTRTDVKKETHTGLDRPWGFQEAEDTRFLDNRHMKVVRLSALRTGRIYLTDNIPGTHFC
jgi:hypothetical protein